MFISLDEEVLNALRAELEGRGVDVLLQCLDSLRSIIFGEIRTHCRTGTMGKTLSTTCAAVSATG
jgi:hypothetical protein